MDINVVRGLITAVLIIVFLGICIWAFSGKRKKDFEEAARLPLDDNGQDQENRHE